MRRANLKEGQKPFIELVSLRYAHDVRKLCVCCTCGEIGDETKMIRNSRGISHGRCYVFRHGLAAFLSLPRCKTEALPVGDLGVELMTKLVEEHSS